RHAICVALHPGWVQTDMGGPKADLTPQQSVTSLRRTLAGLTQRDNGSFHNYDGTPLPW
ncbi:short chain dehydrogenase, partial [Paraburkholderia sp. SIMBA_050]